MTEVTTRSIAYLFLINQCSLIYLYGIIIIQVTGCFELRSFKGVQAEGARVCVSFVA